MAAKHKVKRKMSKADRLRKAQKAAQSPAAKAKRKATFERKRAERMAAAAKEFAPLGEPTGPGYSTIPLDAIPDRPFNNASVRRKPYGAADPRAAKRVVIEVPGGIRITIQFSE